MRLTTCLITISAGICLSATSAQAVFKEFRDISASCSNGLTCEVQMTPKGQQSRPLFKFAFERPGGLNAPLRVLIGADGPFTPGSEVTFDVDGKRVLALRDGDLNWSDDDREYRLDSAATALGLLQSARNGNVLTIGFSGEKGPDRVDFSLSGLVAGLIFIDEAQGRAGTAGALQATGSQPAAAIDARDILTIADIPETIRADFAGPDGDCSFMDEASFGYRGGFETEVEDGWSLIGLPCAEGGAYNQPYLFYSSDGDEVTPLRLPSMTEDGPSVTDQAWNIDWDARQKIMTAFFKGRGIGDCGSWDRYAVKSYGAGPAFVLLESRTKGDCDGKYDGGPENWPASWPPQKR